MMEPEVFLQIGAFLNWVGIALAPILLLPLLTVTFPRLFSEPSKRLRTYLERGINLALHFAVFSAIVLVLVQLAVVIASYAFALSWTWLSEAVIYAFATVFMLGSASALTNDAHVRVDILRPRFGERGRYWIELGGTYLFLFPIMIRLISLGEQGLSRSWLLFEGSRESDGLPILYLFKTLVPVFAVLMIAAGMVVALRAALKLTGGWPAEAEDKTGAETHYGA